MLDRKLYKTKLCILFQRGHCPRQSCSFAHGDAELRRFTGSLSGRRDNRGSDLREKLDRRHSPYRRHSPGRDGRGRHAFRGYSPSRSPVKESVRRHKKRKHVDGQSDASGSLKISDGADDRTKEGKISSSDDKDLLEEQLRQVQLDIDMLDDHKCQLELCVEEKVQEVDSLVARNEELDAQLNKEQQDCKRLASKIKKFIKAHVRYTRAEEELKRTQARLQRLGDQLGWDTSNPWAIEEDSSVNIHSDGEPNGDNSMSPGNAPQKHSSPTKRRLHAIKGCSEDAKPGNSRKKDGLSWGVTKSEKLLRSDGPIPQSDNINKEPEPENKSLLGNNFPRPLINDDKPHRLKNAPPSSVPLEKVKGLDSGHVLPSTSMAAHAVDEFIEAMEMSEKIEAVDVTTASLNVSNANKTASGSHLPPPPPSVSQNTYNQYEGDDEDVDVEDVDVGDPDPNIEVEIVQ